MTARDWVVLIAGRIVGIDAREWFFHRQVARKAIGEKFEMVMAKQ